jgi:hypothetical protein
MRIVVELLNGIPVSATAHDNDYGANRAFEELIKKMRPVMRQEVLDEHVSNGYYIKGNYSIYIMR